MPDQNKPADQNSSSPNLGSQNQGGDLPNQATTPDEAKIQSEINQVVGKTQPKQAPIQTTQPTTPKPVVEETSTPPPPTPPPDDDNSAPPAPPPHAQKGEGPPSKKEQTSPPPPPGGDGDSEGNQPLGGIPPVVTSPKPKGKFGGKKIIATILGILFLVGGIGAGVILVQRQQDIREKARLDLPCKTCSGTTCASTGIEFCSPILNECTTNVDCGGVSCTPGEIEIRNCTTVSGTKGKQERKCLSNGSWNSWNTCAAIAGGGCPSGSQCDVGDYQTRNCTTTQSCPGKQERNCDANTCKWKSWSECVDIADNCPSDDTGGKVCTGQAPVGPDSCKNNDGTYNRRCVIIYCPNGLGADGRCNLDDQGAWQKFGSCADLWNSLGANQCGQIDTVNENNVYCDPLNVCGSRIVDRANCSDTPPKKPPPDTGFSAQCLNIQVFDTKWNKITDLSSLMAGDTIRLTVSGGTTKGSIDKARFTINGSQKAAVTQKRAGTNEFFDEYTIPDGVKSFTINAQLHHTDSSVGWF